MLAIKYDPLYLFLKGYTSIPFKSSLGVSYPHPILNFEGLLVVVDKVAAHCLDEFFFRVAKREAL